MNFDLKKFLKAIKLNEENISMLLGALVLIIVGVLVVNYFKDKNVGSIPGGTNQTMAEGEHTVVAGETLWSIAEDSYGSGYNWVDIKEANELKTNTIEVGQKLIIPDNVDTEEPTVTESVSEPTSMVSSITSDTYTVVKGDCLWNIAVRAYGDGFRWTEIAEVNELANPDLIYPGDVLTLPR